MKRVLLPAWGLLAALFATLLVSSAVAADVVAPRKAAIFVENRAGAAMNDKVLVFEDLLTARISGKGYTVISRETVINAINQYPVDPATPVANNGEQKLDRLLSESTSALRLSQNLGAEFILAPSLVSFGHERKTYTGNGVTSTMMTYTLRVSYKVAEAGQGGNVAGDTVAVNKSIRYTEGLDTENADLINGLLDEAAGLLAEKVTQQAARVVATTDPVKAVGFNISCGMTDLAQIPMNIPDIRLGPDNTVQINPVKLEVQALDVTVELDGVVVGSAPGNIKAAPGLHKLRLSREGFEVWERTINVMDGQNLKIALQMSKGGYDRWKESLSFFQALENNRKLTDAEVKVLEGHAQQLRQSGYKVDTKTDIKVDTKEGIKLYKSIF